jgi:MFS family permease
MPDIAYALPTPLATSIHADVCTSAVQAAMLPSMAYFLGERRLLITGLLFSIVEQAMLALVTSKWQALAAVSLGSLAGVSFPAISSIKSTHSRPDQQGLVQGALAGIRALATGLGPLAFAQLFSSCTKTSAGERLGYTMHEQWCVALWLKVAVYCPRIAGLSWASGSRILCILSTCGMAAGNGAAHALFSNSSAPSYLALQQ